MMRPVDYTSLVERRCSVCKVVKPISEFGRYNDAGAPQGWRYYSRCKECNCTQASDYGAANKPKRNARLRAWRASNPEKARALDRRKRLKQKYDLTPEEADALLAENGGRCLICNDAPAVCIDHCHNTGNVRGGLCVSCNTFLGRVESNPQILPRMTAYLGQSLLELANQEAHT